jgi:hypothetical protein
MVLLNVRYSNDWHKKQDTQKIKEYLKISYIIIQIVRKNDTNSNIFEQNFWCKKISVRHLARPRVVSLILIKI